jgi:hypothetical protein
MESKLNKEELIDLVKDIMDVKGKTEEQLVELLEVLKKNVPHPAPSDLIYWENLTPEEIVDKALSYKPIQL